MLRTLGAYALIWTLFVAVPQARAVVLVQRRSLRSALAGRFWKGLICGSALVFLAAGVQVAGGAYAYAAPHLTVGPVLRTLAWVTIVAFTEEMMVRGLLLTRLRQLTGSAVAVTVTALVFAVMHGSRSDFSRFTALQYLADGVLFGTITVVTGDIWAAAGFHLAKNLGTSLMFGASRQLTQPLLMAIPGGIDTNVADLVAYLVVGPLCLFMFTRGGERSPRR